MLPMPVPAELERPEEPVNMDLGMARLPNGENASGAGGRVPVGGVAVPGGGEDEGGGGGKEEVEG